MHLTHLGPFLAGRVRGCPLALCGYLFSFPSAFYFCHISVKSRRLAQYRSRRSWVHSLVVGALLAAVSGLVGAAKRASRKPSTAGSTAKPTAPPSASWKEWKVEGGLFSFPLEVVFPHRQASPVTTSPR